jgi:hypothetical protein
MGFRVFWRVPQQLLCVELEGILTIDDFKEINQTIVELMDSEPTNQRVALLIDITKPSTAPRAFDQLRASQTYVLRPDLKFILVAGRDKFMRLMMLLTFNLCRPSLKFFENVDSALNYVQVVTATPHS